MANFLKSLNWSVMCYFEPCDDFDYTWHQASLHSCNLNYKSLVHFI